MILRLALFSFLLLSQVAFGDVLFEGFYRIESRGRHIGYMIQRLSREPGAKTKTVTSFIHTRQDGKDEFETIKSVVNEKTMKPILVVHGDNLSGRYIESVTRFSGGKALLEVHDRRLNKILQKSTLDVRLVSMPGAFLFYGGDIGRLQIGKNYDFNFYAERVRRPAYGQLSVAKDEKLHGMLVRQVVADILGEPTENFLTINGDPLGARSPANGTTVYWVKTKDEAVGTMEYPNKHFITFFGDLPEGKKNPWFGLADFNALKVINSFGKSFGLRKLAVKEREKVTMPLPRRAN